MERNDEIEALRARIAVLEAALEPFANIKPISIYSLGRPLTRPFSDCAPHFWCVVGYQGKSDFTLDQVIAAKVAMGIDIKSEGGMKD
jgi:hypothetical protein